MAGLYIHIPFCERRCIYCDFYFVTTKKVYEPFVQALVTELEYYGHQYGSLEGIETIYFGGGTPSLLPVDQVNRVLAAIDSAFDTSQVSEITFEANPDDMTSEYMSGLKDAGINRLSIGVQSLFRHDLSFMNRSHTAEQAQESLQNVRKAGFENYSLDLIFGVPDQPSENWAANLERAVSSEAPHLSIYGLTVEDRTVLAKLVERARVEPMDDDEMNERYQFAMSYLRSHSYEHYEISSFSRPGFRSRHNQSYWDHNNYVGIGPSAHSFWWNHHDEPRALRWSNIRNLNRYEALLNQGLLPIAERERLSYDTLANEYLMLRLRTSKGLSLDTFEERYGVDLLTEKVDELAWLESREFIEPIRMDSIRLSDKGKILCDSIINKLILAV